MSRCVVRNALTGFRSGWQHSKAAKSSDVNSSAANEPAQVERFDYAADNSEDDTKEAQSMSIIGRKRTKDNKPSTVHFIKLSPNQ